MVPSFEDTGAERFESVPIGPETLSGDQMHHDKSVRFSISTIERQTPSECRNPEEGLLFNLNKTNHNSSTSDYVSSSPGYNYSS